MRLRPYMHKDFDVISQWITDERTHAFWCADLLPYPPEKNDFDERLRQAEEKFGDSPFAVTDDNGKVIGFFCYSLNLSTNEGMLKFVILDPSQRGKGYGKAMLKLAVEYAFNITKADAVQLNVFSENTRARKCYESVGFIPRRTDANAFGFKDESWARCNMVIKKKHDT